MIKVMGAALSASLVWAGSAGAQAVTVSLTLKGVHSSQGNVMASLCDDPKAQFPGGCGPYRALAKATAGDTVVTFPGVKPGRYALQAFHDENGDFIPEVPPEGFAFGNGAPFPVSFEAATIQVTGDTRVEATMTYPGGGAAPEPGGSKGTAPPPGVTRADVRDGGLYGELYAPEHGARLPAIIVMGGSEGGLDVMSGMAISFARQGYAALALAYWKAPGLPQTLEGVPLEYFDRAVAWLKARPEVDPKAIGAIGWSRGSEAVLLLGSRNPDVHAVAAIAPSGIVWQGLNYADMRHVGAAWTAAGRPLPYVTPDGSAYRPNGPMRPMFTAAFPDADRRPETAIPVERINGPILLISGEDDQLWPSSQMAGRIVARLQAKGFRHGVQNLVYPGAGHVAFAGAPDSAMAKALSRPSPMLGGSAEADAKAWADNWPKALDFFKHALKGGRR